MVGLEETVTIVKSPTRAYAERANGQRQPLAELIHDNGLAYRARYGATTPGFHEELLEAVGSRDFEAAVYWTVPEGLVPTSVSEDLRAATEVQRGAAREQFATLLASEADSVASWLAALGFEERGRASLAPAIFGSAPANVLLAIANDPRVAILVSNAPVAVEETAATDPVAFARIDTAFNAQGIFAEGERVGILEWGQYVPGEGACRLYDQHEAFEYNTMPVTYQTEDTLKCPNGSSGMCPGLQSGCDTCVDKLCVTDHGSEVASVVTHSKGSPYGAAAVEIYFPNAQPVNTAQGRIDAYEWLLGNGVYTTIESFHHGGWGPTEDYYARRFQVTVVSGAGNAAPQEGRACEAMLNDICVGSNNSSLKMSCFSSWLNPPGTDREEPDLVALGGDYDLGTCYTTMTDPVETLGFASGSDWTGQSAGTSFAAPSVGAIALLVREACRDTWPFLGQKQMRAILRTAAWSANPDDQARYSTPTTGGADFRDGAGWLSADGAAVFCAPGGNADSGFVDLDLTAGEHLPKGEQGYVPGQQPQTVGARPMSYAPPGPGDGRAGMELARVSVREGQRIRATISWDSCALHMNYPAIGAIQVDLDLFLHNNDTQTYVYGSQSVDDNNEGFDVKVDQSGKYSLWVGWPENAGMNGCGGVPSEPFGWAWVVL